MAQSVGGQESCGRRSGLIEDIGGDRSPGKYQWNGCTDSAIGCGMGNEDGTGVWVRG